jgi:hypothetical protein
MIVANLDQDSTVFDAPKPSKQDTERFELLKDIIEYLNEYYQTLHIYNGTQTQLQCVYLFISRLFI